MYLVSLEAFRRKEWAPIPQNRQLVVKHHRAGSSWSICARRGRAEFREGGLGLEDVREVPISFASMRLTGSEVTVDEAEGRVIDDEACVVHQGEPVSSAQLSEKQDVRARIAPLFP